MPRAERVELQLGVYDALVLDAAWPAPDFREYNFAYGPNGSGKTSLARALLAAADLQGLSTLLFNHDYARSTLATADVVEGLWVVAADADEIVGERDRLRAELGELEKTIEVAGADLRAAEGEYGRFLDRLADDLRTGKRRVHGGAAQYPAREVEAALSALPEDRLVADDPTPQELLATLEQASLARLDPAPIEHSVAPVRTLIRVADDDHAEDLLRGEEAVWLADVTPRAGTEEGEPCPYCAQPLTAVAVDHVRGHSARTYDAEAAQFTAFRLAFDRCRAGLLNSVLPAEDDFDVSLREDAARVLAECSAASEELSQELSKRPSVSAVLAPDDGGDTQDWIAAAEGVDRALHDLLALVRGHEDLRGTQADQKMSAFELYEQLKLTEAHEEWQKRRAIVDAAQQDLESGIVTQDELRQRLSDLTARIRGLMSPEVLNEDLRRYLGHEAIRFESRSGDSDEVGYRVLRADGSPAKRLSEGEITAIALLYFLREVENRQPLDLVVVDDPVTSLDDAGIYSAYSTLRQSLRRDFGEDGPAVFVLTHSHPLFRLLVDWASGLNRDGRERALLLETLAQLDAGSTITCRLRMMPESIAGAGSEYAILMARLIDLRASFQPASSPNSVTSVTEFFVAPNIARRVLEAFLTFKYGGPTREGIGGLLERAFNRPALTDFGQERRERLYKLLNTQSHGLTLVDSYEAIGSTAELRLVIGDVLDLIREVDPDHFGGFYSD